MKKLSLIITSLTFVILGMFISSSCSYPKLIIKGTYQVDKTSIVSESSVDDVWNRVIDFFAENNIPIATLEKESGLIVATNVLIKGDLVAMEDSEGVLQNKNAWFVFPYKKNHLDHQVECSFNVRVRKNSDGKTFIGVNVSNIQGKCRFEYVDNFLRKTVSSLSTIECQSTGKFESDLLNLFK